MHKCRVSALLALAEGTELADECTNAQLFETGRSHMVVLTRPQPPAGSESGAGTAPSPKPNSHPTAVLPAPTAAQGSAATDVAAAVATAVAAAPDAPALQPRSAASDPDAAAPPSLAPAGAAAHAGSQGGEGQGLAQGLAGSTAGSSTSARADAGSAESSRSALGGLSEGGLEAPVAGNGEVAITIAPARGAEAGEPPVAPGARQAASAAQQQVRLRIGSAGRVVRVGLHKAGRRRARRSSRCRHRQGEQARVGLGLAVICLSSKP